MKKLLCLLLALMMLLALMAGCDSDKGRRRDDDDDDSKSAGILKQEDDDDDAVVTDDDAVVTDDDDVVTDDVSSDSTTEATQPAQEASNLSIGRWEGNTYINEYTGYACVLDGSWQIYTAEDLQDLPEQIKETTGGEKLGELMANFQQFTDMMAENTADLTTVNLLYQKLTPAQMTIYGSLTEEEVIDRTLEEVAMLEDYYNSMGFTVYSQEKVRVTFLGEEHYALYSVMEIQGVPYYTLQLQNFSLGEYGVTLTLASYVDDKTESLLDLFAPLN